MAYITRPGVKINGENIVHVEKPTTQELIIEMKLTNRVKCSASEN
jgi:hypothetical protein